VQGITVVLFETALGGLALLWLAPLWGVVRPGFFKLAGATVLGCAALAWLTGRQLAAVGPGAAVGSGWTAGRAAAAWLGLFTAAVAVWQGLLYARTAAARWAGVAAVAPGLVAGVLLAQLSGRPLLGLVALGTGALFLGATVDGLLLGHWYLVDRRLSNRPILALATWFIVGVGAALVSAALGGERGTAVSQSLSPLLAVPNLTVWLAVGSVLVCALIAVFIRLLVRGGSIQAATGMFYLAVIMALTAELAAKVYFLPLPPAGS
jgi:hypothetical protein